MSGPALVVEDLRVTFQTDTGPVPAVRGASYEVSSGEVLGLVGESGSGKTVSALAAIGLLPRRTEVAGSVRFAGQEMLGLKPRQLNRVRGSKLAMVFQDPMTSLNPVHRVGAQIAEVVRAHQKIGRSAAWATAVDALRTVGIPEPAERARSYPHEFSGGMRQRVMIAMAIANRPDVLIADEPTTALDVTVQAQVLETLRAVQGETGVAIVFVTHDLGVVAQLCDRVAVMYAGQVVESGRAEDIFARPAMPYTEALLEALPRPDRPTDRLTPIVGSAPSPTDLPSGCAFHPRCSKAVGRCRTDEPSVVEVSPRLGHRARCLLAEPEPVLRMVLRTASPDGPAPESPDVGDQPPGAGESSGEGDGP